MHQIDVCISIRSESVHSYSTEAYTGFRRIRRTMDDGLPGSFSVAGDSRRLAHPVKAGMAKRLLARSTRRIVQRSPALVSLSKHLPSRTGGFDGSQGVAGETELAPRKSNPEGEAVAAGHLFRQKLSVMVALRRISSIGSSLGCARDVKRLNASAPVPRPLRLAGRRASDELAAVRWAEKSDMFGPVPGSPRPASRMVRRGGTSGCVIRPGLSGTPAPAHRFLADDSGRIAAAHRHHAGRDGVCGFVTRKSRRSAPPWPAPRPALSRRRSEARAGGGMR